MSGHAWDVLLVAVGAFLVGWNPVTYRDRKRLDWLLARLLQTRADLDAAMAAEAAHESH